LAGLLVTSGVAAAERWAPATTVCNTSDTGSIGPYKAWDWNIAPLRASNAANGKAAFSSRDHEGKPARAFFGDRVWMVVGASKGHYRAQDLLGFTENGRMAVHPVWISGKHFSTQRVVSASVELWKTNSKRQVKLFGTVCLWAQKMIDSDDLGAREPTSARGSIPVLQAHFDNDKSQLFTWNTSATKKADVAAAAKAFGRSHIYGFVLVSSDGWWAAEHALRVKFGRWEGK